MMNPQWPNGSPIFAGIADTSLFITIRPRRLIDALPSIAPQLVIADLKPEKTDGFDILRECRENHLNTVVVMTRGFRLG